MKITRDIAIGILDGMAADLAKEFDFDQIQYKDIDCGFWDMEHAGPLGRGEDGVVIQGWEKGSMSKYLKAKYGDMVEYKYYAKPADGEEFKPTISKGSYVGLRYRFGMPCISIHQDGNTYMGELELTQEWLLDENGEPVMNEKGWHEYIDEYRVGGLTCFKERGIVWGQMLYNMWLERIAGLKES